MVWQTVSPDGTKSVKLNETLLQDNTTYTKTTMNVDHFWDNGADEAGHHQFAQMPQNETGGNPSDPTIAVGMDLAYFAKKKTAVEAPAAGAQNVQPFSIDASGTSQLLGMRACGAFNIHPGTGVITQLYTHNIKTQAAGGIVTVFDGLYQISFTTALPSTSYLILGMGAKYEATASNKPLIVSLTSDSTMALKTVDKFSILTTDYAGTLVRPLEVSFVVFGG